MIKGFVLAVQFLTRIPIAIRVDFEPKTISKSVAFFPMVGIIVGSISALVYYIFNYINSDIASVAAVLTIVLLTGGLHLDGLSDTMDGFFSGRSRDRILEIMKDSRVGAFGVIAIVFNLLLKYVIIKSFNSSWAITSIILSCGIGRVASSLLISYGKSARPGGLGDIFASQNTKGYFFGGLSIFIIVGMLTSGLTFIAPLLIVIMFTLWLRAYSYRIIGGLTGDVYGATCELGEIISLFTFLVVSIWI